MTYSDICHRIAAVYDAGEARAIARYLIEELCAMSYADILCGGVEHLSTEDVARLDAAVSRIEQGEPLQHVLGYAYFCGNRFRVNSSVLIPRPETEWLVDEGERLLNDDSLFSSKPHHPSKRILDIGTGSGCISISLKLRLADAYVEAWDISDAALTTAQDNAATLNADVVFNKHDALCAADEIEKAAEAHSCDTTGSNQHDVVAGRMPALPVPWDLIVSNPPYICNSERADMADNVLLHEPHTALFVPDDDPLRFYRAIARYALLTLNEAGSLLFECNTRYAEATGAMLCDMGFEGVAVSDDCFGLPRFVTGRRKKPEKNQKK